MLAWMGHVPVLCATRGFLTYSRDHEPKQGRGLDSGHKGTRRMLHRRPPNGGENFFSCLVFPGGCLLKALRCPLPTRTTPALQSPAPTLCPLPPPLARCRLFL